MKNITKKLLTITIILGCIALIIVCIALPRVNQVKSENAELRNYIKQLEVNLNIKNMQVKDLQDKVTGLNQEVEYYTIKYHGNALYTAELERRFRITKSYANQAEWALTSMGHDFRQVD